MVKEECPVYNEMLLLETIIDADVLAPKAKWKKIVSNVDKYITELEQKVMYYESKNRKLTEFPNAVEPEQKK